jgi:hypothetical protein
MANQPDDDGNWLAVIGRSLAFLCLSEADLRDKDLVPQARFLQGLGLSRADAAQMLGTTADSLGVMERRARKRKKDGRKNGKKKTKGR